MENHKILIIKTGYSEFLENSNNSREVSFGDVLRITPILHLYKNDSVTWVADPKVFPLLDGIKYIDNLLPYDFTTVLQLESQFFDTLINLEKIPGICALSDRINAWRKYGFRFDPLTGKTKAYENALEVLGVSTDPIFKKNNKKTTQELLFEMIGETWKGEEYLLGYSPKSTPKYDIALNTLVGKKWPNKAWPFEKWDKLESLLIKEGLKVTRQEKQKDSILNNLYDYMDWMNSANLIITNDSLGTHLGLALKKKVIGLFGPTPSQEFYFYDRGVALTPEPHRSCIPCFRTTCENGISCMNDISVERVYEEVKKWI